MFFVLFLFIVFCEVNEVIYKKNFIWKELNFFCKVDVVFVCSEGEKMEFVVKLLVFEKMFKGYLFGFV